MSDNQGQGKVQHAPNLVYRDPEGARAGAGPLQVCHYELPTVNVTFVRFGIAITQKNKNKRACGARKALTALYTHAPHTQALQIIAHSIVMTCKHAAHITRPWVLQA